MSLLLDTRCGCWLALAVLDAARSLIETELPAEVLAEINLDTLCVESGTLVDPALQGSAIGFAVFSRTGTEIDR